MQCTEKWSYRNARKEIPGIIERRKTQRITENGFDRKAATYQQTHARILLLADEGVERYRDVDIAKALQVGIATVGRVRRRWVEGGLESALNRH